MVVVNIKNKTMFTSECTPDDILEVEGVYFTIQVLIKTLPQESNLMSTEMEVNRPNAY